MVIQLYNIVNSNKGSTRGVMGIPTISLNETANKQRFTMRGQYLLLHFNGSIFHAIKQFNLTW